MKSMKGLSVNKVFGSIRRKASNVSARNSDGVSGTTPASTPEITAHNSVKAFCESGGKAQSDEVLFLPPIVDAAECSPSAAAECARIIRKYMSRDYTSRPSWQYNAIMLLRILADNPGATFTRNFDQKFVDTTRQLLKGARDPSVRQILMETLDDMEHTKMDDENLTLLISMWKKEKEKAFKDHPARAPTSFPQPPPPGQPQYNPHSQNYFARSHSNKRLPDPVELASRLEEARTSAKLLEQVVMNTPPTEMLDNDLIKEFADRCQSASRSIQGYMTSENPTPDNETMENLIDTNELLQTALNQHKRSVLNSRKHLGLGQRHDSDTPVSIPLSNGSEAERYNDHTSSGFENPPLPDRHSPTGNGKGKDTDSYAPPPGPPPGVGSSGSGFKPLPDATPVDPFEDPFRDPQTGGSSRHAGPSSNGEFESRLAYEPFHPGFGTTESYLNRQDSAADKVAMHGARPLRPPTRGRDDPLRTRSQMTMISTMRRPGPKSPRTNTRA
ncbi:hypothetical protein G7Z17_g8290 [Cylindrodendrum hubeiense]|uniref:GAT domain-containing protein n=1 Tax=Cylindrodendrum hubeiense TaxID=595255 RepID=A0A9P5H3X9_9HYPO|nr:hypothetical protein G7Z17_g8290 [Cylindrodendrum hubeiense]